VQYRAYVQNIGWQPWVFNGQQAGTTGQSLQIEAIEISISGKVPPGLGVVYQVSTANVGWQALVVDAGQAAVTGQGEGIEAIAILLAYTTHN
jgi:uncharacterized protein YjdB